MFNRRLWNGERLVGRELLLRRGIPQYAAGTPTTGGPVCLMPRVWRVEARGSECFSRTISCISHRQYRCDEDIGTALREALPLIFPSGEPLISQI